MAQTRKRNEAGDASASANGDPEMTISPEEIAAVEAEGLAFQSPAGED